MSVRAIDSFDLSCGRICIYNITNILVSGNFSLLQGICNHLFTDKT